MAVDTEQLWHEMREKLAGFFRRRVKDEDRVGDLVAETFLRVHAGLDRVREDDRVEAWVWRVARNVLEDHRRRQRAEEGVGWGAGDAPESPDSPGDTANPSEAAEGPGDEVNFNSDVKGWLQGLLEGDLSPEHREAVRLADLDGVPQGEIAARLGLSLTATKSRVRRGRARLRELVAACCHLEFDRHRNIVAYRRLAPGACCGTPRDQGPC